MHEPLTFRRTLDFIVERWRLFTIVGLAAIVLSTVFSHPYFIKPRYRSQAVVYPVHISTYSIETTSDQLLQLLESNSIRDSLVQRFDLIRHYGIDTTRPASKALLNYMWGERVSIEKTRYESVSIKVTDEDPVLARDMVEEILRQADLLARRLQRENSAELLEVIRLGLRNTRHRLDSVEARLNELRAQGLLNYKIQAKEYSRAAAQGRASDKAVDATLKVLEAHGGELDLLQRQVKNLTLDYNEQLSQEGQVLLDLGKELSYSNLVVYPEVADKKIWPIRWLIVLISTFSALLLCYVLAFLREQPRSDRAS